jgi:hypothetical protein
MRVSNNNKAVYFIINIQNPCGWNFKAVFKSCASLALLSNCDVVDSFNNLASNLSKTALLSSLPSVINVS